MESGYIKKIIKKIWHNAISFILSKGTAFVAPLMFLKFVSISEYGIIEYSYSMGTALAIVASLGFYGAYPYFILKKQDYQKEQSFLSYGIIGIIATISISSLYHFAIIPQTWFFVSVFTLVFAIQRLISARYKSADKGQIGVLFDSGYYFLLLFVIIIVWLFKSPNPIAILQYFLEIYLYCICILLLVNLKKHLSLPIGIILKQEIPQILSFSYKMIISGFLVFWLTSSARIYINWFMGYENVGIYSFYFRMAGVSVIIYQFLSIAFFKSLYVVNAKKMDFFYSIIMIVIAIGCLVCSFIIPYIAKYLNSTIALTDKSMYVILCLQMPIWVGFALGEAIIGRENIVNQFNLAIGILVVLFPLVLLAMKDNLNLINYAFATGILFFLAYLIQLRLLWKKDIKLRMCFITSSVLIITSIVYYFSM